MSSRGQQQRVRLAQALAHEPALLFLDEPTMTRAVLAQHDAPS